MVRPRVVGGGGLDVVLLHAGLVQQVVALLHASRALIYSRISSNFKHIIVPALDYGFLNVSAFHSYGNRIFFLLSSSWLSGYCMNYLVV